MILSSVPEIEELRNLTRYIHEKLAEIMMSENNSSQVVSKRKKRSPSFISLGSNEFKTFALKSTNESLKTANKIPESVLGLVDFDSSIVENSGKCLSFYCCPYGTKLSRAIGLCHTLGA